MDSVMPSGDAVGSTASVKVWQYRDEGDARGILVGNLQDTFDKRGERVK